MFEIELEKPETELDKLKKLVKSMSCQIYISCAQNREMNSGKFCNLLKIYGSCDNCNKSFINGDF